MFLIQGQGESRPEAGRGNGRRALLRFSCVGVVPTTAQCLMT